MRNTLPVSDHKRRRSPTPSSASSSSISVNTSLSSSSSSRSRSPRSSRSGSRPRRRSPRSPKSASRSPPRGKDPSARRPDHVRAVSPPRPTTSRAEPPHGADRQGDRSGGTQKPPPAAGAAVPLSSANVRKLGTTKADSDDKEEGRKFTEKEEMDLYLKTARERIGSWNPGSPPSVVAAEVQRVLTERFAKGVSQRGISLLTSLLDDLCLSASHMTEVVEVLSQRLATSHAAWENEVRSRTGASAVGSTRPSQKSKLDKRSAPHASRQNQLLSDWYIVDGLLKHFRSRALKEEKERKKLNADTPAGANDESPDANGGPHRGPSDRPDLPAAAAASLPGTLIRTLSDAIPMLIDRYLPRRAEFPTSGSTGQPDALKELERFREMVRTWKHVVPRVTVQMAATQLGLA